LLSARYGISSEMNIFEMYAIKWQFLRLLIAGLTLREHNFNPRSVHVTLLDTVEMGQTFLRVLRSSSVAIIPSMLHTPLHLHAAVVSRINRRRLGDPTKINGLLEIEEHCIAQI
jgi:hypothetical protein